MRRTAVTAVFLSLGLALTACGSRVDPAGTGGAAPAAASCVDTSGSSIKIGFLNSRSGTMAISENTVYNSLKMASDEINAAGGVLGKQLTVVAEDGASEPTVFAEKAQKLIRSDCVAAVFGGWTSSSRKAMLPVFEGNNALLFYPVQYEGLESSKNIFYTGATTNQQIVPALDYLKEKGAKSLFLVGSDYVFPQTANKIIKAYAAANGMEIKGEEYAPLGYTDFSGSPTSSTSPPGILPHGQKQWLEIGMLLVQDAKLLMLDEPVAGMSAEEKDGTGRLLQRIAEDRTVVIVEHDMDFMRAFAKSVTVLHAGKVLSEGSVAAVQADPRVQEVYLGPGHRSEDEVAAVLGGGLLMLPMLDVEVGYGRTSVIHGVTVEVPADGVAAVMGHNGAGKTTLLRAAVGLLPVRSGRILLDGEDVTGLRPAPAGAARAGLRPAGPAVVRADDDGGEPAARRRRQAQRSGADRRGAGPVPGAARPADPPRRPALRAASASSWRSPGR